MSNSMEEKNSMESPPLSPLSTEPEPNSSEQLVESPVHSDPSPDENEALSAEHVESDTGDVMEPKKKRGRPRKYQVDEDMGSAIPASNSESSAKRARGRPKGSGKLQLLAANGEFFSVFFLPCTRMLQLS